MRSSARRALAAVACAALWSALPGHAQTVAQRAAACAACHGADGNATMPNMPSLAAQPPVFLETQLVMIREGLREVPEMKGMLDGVSDQDITALAKHFSSLPAKPAGGELRAEQFERGRQIASKMQCGSCHLPNYEGRQQMPRLAGQREDYLAYSMRQFRDGKTTGRDTIMTAALYGVSDKDILDLAHFLAHVK